MLMGNKTAIERSVGPDCAGLAGKGKTRNKSQQKLICLYFAPLLLITVC